MRLKPPPHLELGLRAQTVLDALLVGVLDGLPHRACVWRLRLVAPRKRHTIPLLWLVGSPWQRGVCLSALLARPLACARLLAGLWCLVAATSTAATSTTSTAPSSAGTAATPRTALFALCSSWLCLSLSGIWLLFFGLGLGLAFCTDLGLSFGLRSRALALPLGCSFGLGVGWVHDIGAVLVVVAVLAVLDD